jgi:tRNA modification GTPase
MNREVVACLTPPGVSAIAVLALQGPTVWAKLRPYFHTATTPEVHQEPRLYRGRLEHDGLGDDLILSLQGDVDVQTIELQTHGGPGIIQWALDFSQRLGCQVLTWQEWLERSSSAPQSLSTIPIWNLLPLATTKKTAAILLDQCHGAFARALEEIQSEFASNRNDPQALSKSIDALKSWESLGHHLVQPWRVVLAGMPNVGKSSLLNALLGFDRAVTSSIPGTTRDLVAATLVWNGFPFEFIDTAGIHESEHPIEQAGMQQARHAYRNADVVLGLIDLSDPQSRLPDQVGATFVVGTKADLPRRSASVVDNAVSSLSRDGINDLLQALYRHVIPLDPKPGQGIPVTEQDRRILDAWKERTGRNPSAQPV